MPVLGALPDPGPLPSWLWLAVLVPIAIGALVGRRSLRAVSRLSTWQIKAETSATACALCAVALTVAVWLSSGSAGADRLAHVGANPWAVGAALLGELAAGCGADRGRLPPARPARLTRAGRRRAEAKRGTSERAPSPPAQRPRPRPPSRVPKLPSSSFWHCARATPVLAPARQSW